MGKDTFGFSRRRLLQGTAAVAGAYAASKMVGGSLIGHAHAQFAPSKDALLIINLRGGYNSIFTGADSFLGSGAYSVTSSNIRDLGNGLFVDTSTFGTLPAPALASMATVGVRHGINSHENSQDAMFHFNNQSAVLMLADAMGGEGSIKAAHFGGVPGSHPPVGSTSLQRITDMGSTIAALGGVTNLSMPDREIAAKGMAAARAMSSRELRANPASLSTVDQGYPAAIDTLQQPVKVFNFAEAAQAYGLNATATGVGSFTSQMLAAELMVHAGTNVIVAQNGGWDTHGDRSAATVRQMMTRNILPGLRTFLNRMWSADGYNVTVAIVGEFARSLPGSDDQPSVSVTVIGKNVKVGTTGKTDANVRLAAGTPTFPGLWAYLATVTSVKGTPFGANPHTALVKA
ncbi:MAG: DUF1501 domain-containing protein [Myxococcaceae bacterium]